MIANAAENEVSIASEPETDSPAVSSEEECSAGEEIEEVEERNWYRREINVYANAFNPKETSVHVSFESLSNDFLVNFKPPETG